MITYLGKLGELTLKGSNIKFFENRLLQNMRHCLESVNVSIRSGRLYIGTDCKSMPAAEFALSHLIGITGWMKAVVCEKDIESIKKTALSQALKAKEAGAKTFKIDARRGDKSFPLNSYQINCLAADDIYDKGILSVDVHHPDVVIRIEVREHVFVYCAESNGIRGLPVGTSGRGLLLLSGGIDSPVAGFRMMRRGMSIDAIYFHAYPYTSDEARKKVEKLAETIANYGVKLHLNIIPFTAVQMKIKEKSPEAWSTMMLRICMIKAANMLSDYIGADCIITGESMGQVASQTIENMTVTEHFANLPVIRPLVGLDKEEIIETATSIGTYETSILPYEDCCVLFSPRHPVLRSSVFDAEEIYKGLDVDTLIKEAFEKREIIRYSAKDYIASHFL